MAKLEMADAGEFEAKLQKLERNLRRETVRRILGSGAAVLEKDMAAEIVARGHRKTGAMAESVARTEIREGLDGAYLHVYTQGEDSRGVRNEMKNTIINYGYWHRPTGRKVRKDPFLQRMRKSAEPKVRSAMEEEYNRCLADAGITS